MNKHLILMLIGCGLPLLFIFLAPVLGLSNNISLFIFILAMFICHLLMPMHHGGRLHQCGISDNEERRSDESH